jgi:hypothetical protein
MSDDIPLIFAETSATPTALFLSASGLSHMQQFATAGWAVAVTADFQSPRPVTLSEVPAQTVSDAVVIAPTLVSCEAPSWSAGVIARVQKWKPRLVKINAAFSELDPARIAAAAKDLKDLGLIVLAAHWRDDNSFRIRSLNRIDRLEALQPPEWSRLSLFGCADENNANAILNIGRLHAGQEQRIAQLRVSEQVRGEHIARLEAALIAAQQSPHFKRQP